MATWQALVLGAVQGLSVFLPISNSGHLIILQQVFGIPQPPQFFQFLVHLGTLADVIAALWDELAALICNPRNKVSYLILVGSVPAVLAAMFLAPLLNARLHNLLVVGAALVVTGAIIISSEKVAVVYFGLKEEYEMTYGDALFIGVMQAAAIVPGVSQLGMALCAGLFFGLERNFAIRFALLLSIPTILVSVLLSMHGLMVQEISINQIIPDIIGPFTAALLGYLAIRLLKKLAEERNLAVFAYYCWVLAPLTILAYYIPRA